MGDISTKPYLIRALHEWCTDSGYTPYIVVQVNDRTLVPQGHVRDGQITLNISALATNKLLLGNEYVEFEARFNGRTERVSVPVGSVIAIYSRETGEGMGFEVEEPAVAEEGEAAMHDPSPALTDASAASEAAEQPGSDIAGKRSHLTVVK
ncbi:ClpXP protease specificity-enhancing factor [Corticimicrobacter populi]|uniref:ClpXP protease specificity-enhancing factor n=1 Tax=Corticimicrobacter populi TaxID=2175229 RepID=A0A2V1JZG6_9BURK|nr:ClpXP protease specificity-enhancing factor [Corticimicrobacter populi]PWF22123.1 ClpXP protease specificity-enhancing factor [Corticimicrobacter populi]